MLAGWWRDAMERLGLKRRPVAVQGTDTVLVFLDTKADQNYVVVESLAASSPADQKASG